MATLIHPASSRARTIVIELDSAVGIGAQQRSCLIVDVRIVAHLIRKCRILIGDVPDEAGGVPLQSNGEFDVWSPGSDQPTSLNLQPNY